MTMWMNFTSDQFKVIKGVIEFVPINMMNNFMREKFSSEFCFHDSPMLKDDFIFLSNNSVSLGTDRSFSVCSFLPEMGISISVPSEVVAIAHPTLPCFGLAIEATVHNDKYIMETTCCQEGRLKNRVNCWEPLTDDTEGNQQPSLSNGKYVDRKVQRLTGEEPTNNPDTSARPERDDIVWTHRKL